MQTEACEDRRAPGLTRREFTTLAAGTVASLALTRQSSAQAAPGALDIPLRYAEDKRPATVALAGITRGSSDDLIEAAVQRAALAATDFTWLSRGDRVLLKPVCNSGNDYPATTDPAALRAMIRLLKEKGAGRVVVGDMSGVQFVRFSEDRLTGSTRELMRRNGMVRAIEAAGGALVAFEEAGWDGFYDERPRASASWRDPILLPKILNEIDHVILMPRCARHLLAGSTLGLKAAVGWWRHDSRLEYHHDAGTFSQKTAESNTVPTLLAKQRLVLTSATKVLTTFGPDAGHVVAPETGLIIASPSVLAHDMVSLAWLLQTRATVPAELKDGVRKDPNQSGLYVNFANRVVTNWLGGFGAALTAEALARYDLDRVWDDRVLRHGATAFGGVPHVEFVVIDRSVPEPLRAGLAADVALSV
ncbi:MAG TPA: DUF362 domain-containing protein [Candidatus Binatia bacterium]|nr:DUF362 domain-containing protein [Candidatus Binatia bacterium]